MTAKETNKLAGIFLMIHGALQTFIMLLIGLIYGVIGGGVAATSRRSDDQMMGVFFIGIAVAVVIFSLIFTVPQIIGGWKLLKERPNARIWGIVASIFACLHFPLGTAAGVFGMVFLFGEEGKRFYLGNEMNARAFPPPPPNNWA